MGATICTWYFLLQTSYPSAFSSQFSSWASPLTPSAKSLMISGLHLPVLIPCSFPKWPHPLPWLQTTTVCCWQILWLRPRFRDLSSWLLHLERVEAVTLSWHEVELTISPPSPQTCCSPILSVFPSLNQNNHQSPSYSQFPDHQAFLLLTTALLSHLQGLRLISQPPLPHPPVQALHWQPSSFEHTHPIVPMLLRFQQFLITQRWGLLSLFSAL